MEAENHVWEAELLVSPFSSSPGRGFHFMCLLSKSFPLGMGEPLSPPHLPLKNPFEPSSSQLRGVGGEIFLCSSPGRAQFGSLCSLTCTPAGLCCCGGGEAQALLAGCKPRAGALVGSWAEMGGVGEGLGQQGHADVELQDVAFEGVRFSCSAAIRRNPKLEPQES